VQNIFASAILILITNSVSNVNGEQLARSSFLGGVLGSYVLISTARVIQFVWFWHQGRDPLCLEPGLMCILCNHFQSWPHQFSSCFPI